MDPIVIAGMGPGGLATALEAAKKGLDVVIIEPRPEFIRGQRLKIDSNIIEMLKKHQEDPPSIEDKKFFDETINSSDPSGKTVQLKDIQRYMASKLSQYDNIKSYMGDVSINHIDPEKQSVIIKSKEKVKEIKFSHFVSGEGAKHSLVDMLNAKLPQESRINYINEEVLQPRQKASGAITMKLKEPVPEEVKEKLAHEPKNFTLDDLKHLYKLGWDQPYFPNVYVFRNNDNNKFFISGEIPEFYRKLATNHDKDGPTVHDLKVKSELIEKWAQYIMHSKYGIPKDSIELHQTGTTAKDRLRATDFDLSIKHADKPSIQLGKGGSYVLIGDCNKNANFFFGHGMNDAIKDGMQFVKNLEKSESKNTIKFDSKAYEEYQKHQIKMMRVKTTWSKQDVDLANLKKELHTTCFDLEKLCSKINDHKLQIALNKFKQKESIESESFDSRTYIAEVHDLIDVAKEALSHKIDKKSKGSMFFSKSNPASKDREKLNNLNAISEKIDKGFEKYLNLNYEQRTSFYQSIQKENKNYKM